MATTVLDLHEIDSISAEDLLHIIDVTRSNEDSKVDIGTLTTYLNTALSIPQTIASVNGLQAALDGKSNVGHTHTIQQIVGLSSALDSKLDSNQANIVGRIVNIKGVAITVPDEITGVRDDRIPDTVIIGEYLQFDAADGGINNISGDTLKTNLAIDLVNNTTDANKPVSTATQSALDGKVDTTTYNTGQTAQDTNITANTTNITANVAAIALNTQKVSFDAVSSAKLDGIEALADVTDTENVWGSLGISGSGSTGQFLTQRGVFVGPPSVTVNKSQIDAAIGASPNGNTTLFYNQAGAFTAPETGDEVTKQAIDNAIGVFPTGDSAQFYNEQGNFIDAVYDSVEDAPIIRNRTIETIVLSGTRSNVQARLTGTSELSIITMQNTFDSSPTQYTTTFTSPNTTFTPALTFPAGSQGRQLSLTEADGTLHRFCYLVNGNYRLLAGGLTGTVRLGPVAVATTATVTAAVTVPDQTAGQTITLVGDETGTFAVGDFISPQANNFGAYRGIFVDSITFDGTNTVIVGPSNGATTFQTTSTIRRAGPATEIQGTIPTFSGDPDIANTVYSSSIPATEFTVLGVNTSAHLIQVANAYAALETAITTDGVVTDNGDGTSSITIDYNTETNIDSSFTITGGLNNMESIVNVDGMIGDLSPATTITLTDPEATEVASFTSSAADTSVNNVDDIAAQLVLAINNNVETPINFDAEYDQATKTIILTAETAGNTNPWTIVFDNNGTTGVNAGNLGYTSSQSGEIINQIQTLSVVEPLLVTNGISSFYNPNSNIDIGPNSFNLDVNGSSIFSNTSGLGFNFLTLNLRREHFNYTIRGEANDVYNYNSTTDTTTINSDTINFIGNTITGLPTGADGLSITDTVNLNLLDGTTVLSTVTLPSSSGTTVIAGTANEIINTVSGDTNTLSLAPAITDAITANTAKTGITTAQAAAITSNTGKTGITVEQSNAIIANTSKVSNIDILPLNNTFTGTNTFSNPATFNGTGATGSIRVAQSIVNDTRETTNIDIGSLGITLEVNDDFYLTCSTLGAGFSNVRVNPSRNDIDFTVRGTTNDAIDYNAGADVLTIGSDVLTIDSTTINGLPSKADALSISGQVLSLLDGTTVLDTVTLPSGGTATTVQGTSGQIGVNTVGNTATVSLDTAITSAITANTNKTGITTAQSDAITANTAKVSVAGLNQVGAAVLSTDSVVYYAGTALAPRRKTFSLLPLSIMNNDSGFTTNTGTVTSVTGTANQINVANGTTTPVVSLNNTITSAITANTSKTGITTAQSSAITANTAKVGITTAQSNAITANTSKTGITTAQATAITNNTAKTGITTAQANAIIANTAKVSNVDILPLDNTFTGDNTFDEPTLFNGTGATGSIRVAQSIVNDLRETTNIDIGSLGITLEVNDDFYLTCSTLGAGFSNVRINPSRNDIDFTVRGQVNDAIDYNAGTDTLDFGAANITGVADTETGTWTPVFQNGAGTLGTFTATYTKSGTNVIAQCQALLGLGTAFQLHLNGTSLPYNFSTNNPGGGIGTYRTYTPSFAIDNSGVVAKETGSNTVVFINAAGTTIINGSDVNGTIGFTITYQTT